MEIEIGQHTYEFALTPGPLRSAGRRCGSVCDHGARRILISDALPPEVRLEVAALAVSEAWRRATQPLMLALLRNDAPTLQPSEARPGPSGGCSPRATAAWRARAL